MRRSKINLIRVLEAKNKKDRGKETFKEIITWDFPRDGKARIHGYTNQDKQKEIQSRHIVVKLKSTKDREMLYSN